MKERVWAADPVAAVDILAKEVRRLRLALEDIEEMVDDSIDADDGRPNLAMRVSMAAKEALKD